MAYNLAMKIANIAELKNRISEFISALEKGEEVEVRKRNAPIARIVPIRKRKPTRQGWSAEKKQAYSLPEYSHRDPADRIIIATARILRCPLVTADRRILDYPHVDAVVRPAAPVEGAL